MSSPRPSLATEPAEPALRRLRVLAWVAVAVVAAGGVLLYALTRDGSTRTPSAGDVQPPVARWAAGARPAPPFRLRDQNGHVVSLASLRGRPVIVTFIDPLCRNFCPLEAKQLNALVRTLPQASRPAIVAVSVNVYGNARANLLQDVARWQLVPEWRWGIGDRKTLARVWRQYGIGVLVSTKTVAGVTVHEVSHTEGSYVIDAKGDERALFLWPFRAADVRSELERLTT